MEEWGRGTEKGYRDYIWGFNSKIICKFLSLTCGNSNYKATQFVNGFPL